MNMSLGDQTESVPKGFAASSSKAQGDVPSPVLWRDSESTLPESQAAVSVYTLSGILVPLPNTMSSDLLTRD